MWMRDYQENAVLCQTPCLAAARCVLHPKRQHLTQLRKAQHHAPGQGIYERWNCKVGALRAKDELHCIAVREVLRQHIEVAAAVQAAAVQACEVELLLAVLAQLPEAAAREGAVAS